ncbi:tRNA (N(6)-L-threonylcarbamoyladenosine(37)-C(2))-methylthiotransferase [Candidatus Woesearchaeota archaeon]|nr:tRNA (N(6)-L-threonylcarbamoyladenosine(37)-C(2))-methylthiotransferase [Candidatus Woesearchaeota archaeon]
MPNIYLETYGCSANQNDSEIMAGILESAGCVIVLKPELADVIIVNTCIVKGKTLSNMYNVLGKFHSEFPEVKLIIAGCLPQTELELPFDASTIGPHNIKDIALVVARALEGRIVNATDNSFETKLGLPKIKRNKAINIVQILEGCYGNCAYCIVKQAKPTLHSFPQKDILKEINSGLRNGAKEIWLTSQDNSAYGLDENDTTKLPELLNEIDKIPGKFLVRVGMMNPNNLLPVLDETIEAFKSEKIFKFIHIPVQSGNDDVLKLMGRKYSIEDFTAIIKAFRRKIPKITLSTDIICGFPGESEAQFHDSVKLVLETKPDIVNISRFTPMPNTKAEEMPHQIHGSITKKRSQWLTDVCYKISYEQNKKWEDWNGEIYVDEIGKNNTIVGRNPSYKPVVLKEHKHLFGKFIKVEVKEAMPTYLKAEITAKAQN